ncbi:MAG: tRNA pseudouridine(55) synthase TruB, partial [Ruminococcaceae bacterium]|nr:tRNA pseudouridine(55) synthase TruB [Oscillospiraceae bacterium]
GTLDPMATGVLVILIGRAAKAAEYLSNDEKGYVATLRLGTTYDTEDITGTPISKCKIIPSEETVYSAINNFVGEITQIPPMYSALKVNGQKLCDLARKGIEIEREARPVTIYSIDAKKAELPTDYILSVTCSAGTYIRTLCADIGKSLNCGGAMATLCRTLAGGFSIENSHTLEEIENLSPDERLSLLIPTESLFYNLSAVNLPAFYEKLCRNGCEIYLNKLRISFELGARIRLCSQNGEFFALGEVRAYENGLAIKAIKLFDI